MAESTAELKRSMLQAQLGPWSSLVRKAESIDLLMISNYGKLDPLHKPCLLDIDAQKP